MSGTKKAGQMHIATPTGVRETKRKFVPTPDGVFLIRKVEGADFLIMASALPTSVRNLFPKNESELNDRNRRAVLKSALKKDAMQNPAPYFKTILERGTVREEVAVIRNDAGDIERFELDPKASEETTWTSTVKLEDADPGKGEIAATDLGYEESLLFLITEIEKFSDMEATLEERLRRFRGSGDSGSGSTGEEDREAGDGATEAADRGTDPEPGVVETSG